MPGTRHMPAGRLWLALGVAVLVPALVGMPAGAAPPVTVPRPGGRPHGVRRRPPRPHRSAPSCASRAVRARADVRQPSVTAGRADRPRPGGARRGARARGVTTTATVGTLAAEVPVEARGGGSVAHRQARVAGGRHRGRRLRRGHLGPGAGQGEGPAGAAGPRSRSTPSTDPTPARRRRARCPTGQRPPDDRRRHEGPGPHRHPLGTAAQGDRADAGERPARPRRTPATSRVVGAGHRRSAGDRHPGPVGRRRVLAQSRAVLHRPTSGPDSSTTRPRRPTTPRPRRRPRSVPSTPTTPSPWGTPTSTTTSSSTGSAGCTRAAPAGWTGRCSAGTPPGSTSTPSRSSPWATSRPSPRRPRTWRRSRTPSPGCSPGSWACTGSTRRRRSSWSPPATSRRPGTRRARSATISAMSSHQTVNFTSVPGQVPAGPAALDPGDGGRVLRRRDLRPVAGRRRRSPPGRARTSRSPRTRTAP